MTAAPPRWAQQPVIDMVVVAFKQGVPAFSPALPLPAHLTTTKAKMDICFEHHKKVLIHISNQL